MIVIKSKILSAVLSIVFLANAVLFLASPAPIESYELIYELPINGATGFVLARQYLTESPNENSARLRPIYPGHPFTIISSQENYLKIEYGRITGWINNSLALVNLPDIIPSIIYFNTNATRSLFQSSGYGLPNIHEEQLYIARGFNSRFTEEQYIMPILYRTAILLYNAQQAALANGNSLKIYETFRPLDIQTSINISLRELIRQNQTVNEGINTNGWRTNWFIAGGVSTHQLGAGVDLALVRVRDYRIRATGGFEYKIITSYTEYTMPSKMHELSAEAVVTERPTGWSAQNGFGGVNFARTMSVGALRLHNYMVDAGFTPLASEWWHFDDWQAWNHLRRHHPTVNGNFRLQGLASRQPTP